MEALGAFPWLWFSTWECSVQAFHAKEELQGVCMGQAVWGKTPRSWPRTTAAFPQAFAVPLPGCCFLTLFNVLLHIMEGTTGTLERTLRFSRACTVFVLEVKEHPQDRGSSWVALSVFPRLFLFSCQNLLRLVDP